VIFNHTVFTMRCCASAVYAVIVSLSICPSLGRLIVPGAVNLIHRWVS